MAKKSMDKSDLELAQVEIDILKISQHPNIIKLYDIYENENYIYIIMEYCGGGDLYPTLLNQIFLCRFFYVFHIYQINFYN